MSALPSGRVAAGALGQFRLGGEAALDAVCLGLVEPPVAGARPVRRRLFRIAELVPVDVTVGAGVPVRHDEVVPETVAVEGGVRTPRLSRAGAALTSKLQSYNKDRNTPIVTQMCVNSG